MRHPPKLPSASCLTCGDTSKCTPVTRETMGGRPCNHWTQGPPVTALVAGSEAAVIAACHAADSAQRDYAIKAVIAGVMLLEHRNKLMSCHDGNSCTPVHWNDRTKGEGFKAFLVKVAIPQRTAYRWMEVAEKVVRARLGILSAEEFSPVIDVGGSAMPISQALTSPDADLGNEAIEFRQGLFEFMAERTLKQAMDDCLNGDSDPLRITRAANGKLRGGAPDKASNPDARKQFPLFAARALSETLTHIGARVGKQGGHWPNLTAAQKHEIEGYLALFVSGLDDGTIDFLFDAIREEAASRKRGKRPEPLALKSALTKRENQ